MILFLVFIVMASAEKPPLCFNSTGQFKVLQLTDTHYDFLFDDVPHTVKVVKTVIELEKPDLVVLTGDLTSGYLAHGLPGWYLTRWLLHTTLLTDLGVKWAYALGNHDGEADLPRRDAARLDSSAKLSYTQVSPEEIGNSTYRLQILDSNCQAHKASLWIFDSGHENCLGVEGWDCVPPEAVSWYHKNADGKPGFAFMHIPLPEYMYMASRFPIAGKWDEEVCCSSLNTGLFSVFKEKKDVKAVFSGHDHNNDFEGSYNGIDLIYGRKTGYGNYGPSPGVQHGARVIIINEDGSYSTYIRQEDGSIETRDTSTRTKVDKAQDICCGAVGLDDPYAQF